MRLSLKTRRGLAGGSSLLLAGALLLSGCSSIIEGKPVASPGAGPTEPSFPTPRLTPPSTPPATTSPSPAPPTTPASPTPPAGAVPLKPDQNGYVFIETKSGLTRCQINKESVGCEAPFTHSPLQEAEHANGVSITAGGTVNWVLGNLGAIPDSHHRLQDLRRAGLDDNRHRRRDSVHQRTHSPRHVRRTASTRSVHSERLKDQFNAPSRRPGAAVGPPF